MIDGPYFILFQNRDLESQHHRIVNCNRHMVGCSRVEYTTYVSYPH
jgi:hypothetical protein